MRIPRVTRALAAGLLLAATATGRAEQASAPPPPAEGDLACPGGAGGPPRGKGWFWQSKDGTPRQKLLAPVDFGQPALGEFMHRHFQTQVDNAAVARMTLYDYDFVCGTEQLNWR